MEASDSRQEQEQALEQSLDLSPSSSGRERKKNPKFSDYEVSDSFQTPRTKRSRKSTGEGTASPNKQGNAETVGEQEQEPSENKVQDSEKNVPKKTRKRRGRKLWTKKSTGKKTPAKPPGADGAVQDETPKPKRKYVKRQVVKQVVTEVNLAETPTEDVELTLGGRPRRGAAKAALKYLHNLANEVLGQPNNESQPEANGDSEAQSPKASAKKTPKGNKGRRGRKRKRSELNSDPDEDEDFVPNAEDEEEEELEEDEEEIPEDLDFSFAKGQRSPSTPHIYLRKLKQNGLTSATIHSIKVSLETSKKFREEHLSTWVFPDWLPSSSSWQLLPQSEVEEYLPEELESAAFTVFREGLTKEEKTPQRLNRFESLPSHRERWDMFFFSGGPVWALEWCPTPDGASARQMMAVACHRGMDEQHRVNQTYSGSGLIQLWDLGLLQYDTRPDVQPALVYGLAQDRGFVWQLKWCPAGAWEQPDSDRKAPFLPRLGLLAVATSLGLVTIYSLPHPDALLSKLSDSEKSSCVPPIYKAKAVLTLKLGSFKAPRLTQSGQVLTLDWLPQKPHNIIAIGFYDGNVGLWDLNTKSSLLRVREPDGCMSLLPYQCLVAHDNAVRALAFCPASRNLLVTAGDDRLVKTWDLTRLYEPITAQKRCLITEVSWPLNGSGLLLAQETAFAAYYSHGMHYYDHYMQTLFAAPRSGTMWSMAYSDWLNFAATSDTVGEVILCTLPLLCASIQQCKHTIERRFPVYFTSMVPFTTEEEEEAEETSAGGGDEEKTVDGQTEGKENGSDENLTASCASEQMKYRDTVKKYYLKLTDFDLRNFFKFKRRVMWKQMKDTELKTPLRLDDFPLAALHKIRFSPNLSSHCWMATAGQTGLVRLLCVRSAIVNESKRFIRQNQRHSRSRSPAEIGSETEQTQEPL